MWTFEVDEGGWQEKRRTCLSDCDALARKLNHKMCLFNCGSANDDERNIILVTTSTYRMQKISFTHIYKIAPTIAHDSYGWMDCREKARKSQLWAHLQPTQVPTYTSKRFESKKGFLFLLHLLLLLFIAFSRLSSFHSKWTNRQILLLFSIYISCISSSSNPSIVVVGGVVDVVRKILSEQG